MIPSILIIGVSLLLFGYWFRYTCLLILSAKTATDYTSQIAEANQLQFRSVQVQLQADPSVPLTQLEANLNRDFAMLTYLLQHAGSVELAEDTLEQHMLRADYQVMKVCHRLSRKLWPAQALRSLEEMSSV
ncbi:MAG: hypothetical protein ABI823_03230, partial [Bryobacteraceae bacterium]